MEMSQEQLLSHFSEYEELKIEAKKLAERISEVKEIIQPHIPEDSEVAGQYGVFYIQKRKTWKYSDDLKDKEKQLKEMQKEEVAKGVAEPSEFNILVYRENKGNGSEE